MVSVFLDFCVRASLVVRNYSTASYYTPPSPRSSTAPREEESPGQGKVRALQPLSRFDLLGADTVGGGMPFCPPTGSGRNGLGPVVEHAPVGIMGLVIEVLTGEAVATSHS